MILANYVKRGAHIIKQRIYYDNIISTVANLLSVTKTTDNSTGSILQDITTLSSDTIKGDFFCLGVNISDLNDLKKQNFTVEISRMWDNKIVKERARVIAELSGGTRM